MRLTFSAFLLICTLCGAGPARAGPADSCDLIVSLVGLPVDLQLVRADRVNAAEFKRKLLKSLNALGNRDRTHVFSREELRAMRIFAGTVREDWKMNGATPGGRQIPGLTRTSQTIQDRLEAIMAKFGCQMPNASPGSHLWAVDEAPISPLSLLLTVGGFVLGALGIYRLVWRRYQVTRRLCHVPAQLRFEGTTAATHIMDISRGGAMIETAADAPAGDSVILEVAGHDIAGRVAWTNSNFTGLKFDRMLPPRVVDDIAGSTVWPSPENARTKLGATCLGAG